MNTFFFSIPWNGFILVNIFATIIFSFALWIFIRLLNRLWIKFQNLRKFYPPEVSRKLIQTSTPDGDKCPLTILEIRRVVRLGNSTSEIRPTIYVFECPLTPRKPLRISAQFCKPCDEVDGLFQVVHKWPETWYSWLRPDHPRGNTHYIFPASWVRLAKDKIKYED